MLRPFRFFDSAACTACGTCLVRCRYLHLTETEAREARQRLRDGIPVPRVLERCASCYACNAYCPQGLRPYESILEFWHQRYQDAGLPVRARFLMPGSRPNFRTFMMERMPADERRQAADWERAPARMTGTVLYPGCNFLTLPYLAAQPALEGVAVHGNLDLCCGEMLFRMGLFDHVERTARRLTAYYARHAIEEMLFVCPACFNMFTNVLPRQFGARFTFRTRFITDFLRERLGSPPQPLGRKVGVFDSCQGRMLGADFLAAQRGFLSFLGLETTDLAPDLLQGPCCGIAAGCARQSPIDILRTSWDALETGRRAGVREIACYCGGCLLVLNMVRNFHPLAPRPVHLLEYVAESTGRPLADRKAARARTALGGVLVHAAPLLLSPRRFRIE